MKTIIIGTYYQILSFLRVKKAFFFAFLFPTFIFTVFSLVWGGENEDYSKFLLTGVIVLTTASDALFSIGGVIASFYRTGLIRFFKVTPYSYTKHIIALICSRIIIVLFSTAIVLLVAYILNGTKLSCNEILYLIAGLILCIYNKRGFWKFEPYEFCVLRYCFSEQYNLSHNRIKFFIQDNCIT